MSAAASALPRFAVGDAVRTTSVRRDGHTRLPGYLANRRGFVERVHGEYPLADERARGGRSPSREALYGVVFAASEVWGADAVARDTIAADLWESYLEPDQP